MVTSGEGWKEGIISEPGMDMYTLLYLKWITSKDLLSSTGNSAQCHVAAWMGEGFRGTMDTSMGFPDGFHGKASACNVGDPGSFPGSGRSPG